MGEQKLMHAVLAVVRQAGGEVFVAHDDQLVSEERGSLLQPRQSQQSWMHASCLHNKSEARAHNSHSCCCIYNIAKVKSGLTTVSINIEKIGLKDAETYINSFITVSVAGQMPYAPL